MEGVVYVRGKYIVFGFSKKTTEHVSNRQFYLGK